MDFYRKKQKLLLAVDCVIFGFNGESLEILLIKRGMEPEVGKWSLMGGFVGPKETPEDAAIQTLKQLTGINDLYMESAGVFGQPNREPYDRVVSIPYFALVDIKQYQHRITEEFEAKWFPLNDYPSLIFDHDEMVKTALQKLRNKASLYPILFELLPDKFTIPQILSLYESVYNIEMDKRNFNRKLLSTGLLIKTKEKDKLNSRRGAFYYQLNIDVYKEKIMLVISEVVAKLVH